MDARPAGVIDPVLDGGPTVRGPAAGTSVRTGPYRTGGSGTGLLRTGWAAMIGLGWPVALMLASALEPVPADPHAAMPIVGQVTSFALMVAMWTAVFAAAQRHRVAGVAGSITGLLAVSMSVLCPVSGHHHLGLWWFGQFGLVAGMLAVSLAALRAPARAAG